MFRPVGVIFKGPGFYSTDYRKPEEKAKREGEEDKGKPATAASEKEERSD